MSEPVVPYRLIGDAARRSLEERASRAVHAWSHAWLSGLPTDIQVAVEELQTRPTDIHAREACCFRVRARGVVALMLVVPRRSLAGLIGAPQHRVDASTRFAAPGSLVAALEREALLRLSTSLLVGVGAGELDLERMEEGAVDVQREGAAARFLCLCITLGESRCMLDVLIAPGLVEKLLPERSHAAATEPLHSRKPSVASQTVQIEGVLGTAEVSFVDLAALAVGDVVVLDQALGHAGSITVLGGERLAGAALGRVDGKRAMHIKGKAA